MANEGLKSLKLSPAVEEALYAQGYAQYEQGYYMEALQCFHRLTGANIKNPKYWIGLAACYQMQKSYEGAVAFYAFAAMLRPEDPLPHLYAAECLFSLKKTEAGLSALQSAEEASKEDPRYDALRQKVQSLRMVWQPNKREAKLSKEGRKRWWTS
jgi:type III secretion system low calcium response chaperone LcrH/SycD